VPPELVPNLGHKPLGPAQAPAGAAWRDADQLRPDVLMPWSILTAEQRQAVQQREQEASAQLQQEQQSLAVDTGQQEGGPGVMTRSQSVQLQKTPECDPNSPPTTAQPQMFLIQRQPVSIATVMSDVLWPAWQQWYNVMLTSGIKPLWMKAL
jgi:hypothetical protein